MFAAYQELLGDAALTVPLTEELNPPRWEPGHAGRFQAWWIGRNTERHRGLAANPPATRRADALLSLSDGWYHCSRVAHDARWALAPIEADLHPLTWAQFLPFVDSGG